MKKSKYEFVMLFCAVLALIWVLGILLSSCSTDPRFFQPKPLSKRDSIALCVPSQRGKEVPCIIDCGFSRKINVYDSRFLWEVDYRDELDRKIYRLKTLRETCR